MGLTKLDWVLAAGIVAALGGSLLVQPDLTQPNYEYMPDMARASRYGAYEPNPHFADGKTLQRQQPGTIARGQRPFHYAPGDAGAAQAGAELRSPYGEADAATRHRVLERGAAVYQSYCVACHDGGGTGNGAVAQRGFPPPPSLLAQHAVTMPDGRMYHVITLGQGNMPAHGFLVTPDDRWKVIAYIRQLQEDADG